MQPSSLKSFVTVLVGLTVAFMMALMIGQGEPTVPIVLSVLLIGAGIFSLSSGLRVEALFIGGLVALNIVAQGGLPKISLAGEAAPLYPAEIVMVISMAAMCVRFAFTKARFFERYPFSIAILAFIVIGLLRFYFDARTAGGMSQMKNVVRDFATVYYAGLFFIGVHLFQHAPSRRFIEQLLPVAVVLLVPVFTLTILFPDKIEALAIGNKPLFLPRADLSGSFLGFGCVYFLLRRDQRSRGVISWLFLTGLSMTCFGLTTMGLSRATFVGFAFGMGLLLIARQGKAVRHIMAFALAGFLMVVAVEELGGHRNEDRFTKRVVDKIASLTDVSGGGNRSYTSEVGDASAGNNRFRTVWWRSVYDETMQESPWFGLGFGHDLAARFLRIYTFNLGDEFAARSPHNILVTILGRMGFVGLASFLVVVSMMIFGAFRCAWAVRKGEMPALYLAPWCAVVMLFVTACFGVMLEGPMAAVVFWTLLALASTREQELMAQRRDRGNPTPKTIDVIRPAMPGRFVRPPLPAGVGGRV